MFSFFSIFPYLYFAAMIGAAIYFFWIINDIRKSSRKRNAILKDICDEMKRDKGSGV
ncbi:hypothetical protein [Pedobacter faecalis]|uniref:hypothetical protein n=1 Tax=Pedobacter faecalis TaxID=3041495 RepID=UPI00254AB6FC|nr:hypothetical protein [Pedobacter sp. ELA7]